MKLLVLFLLCQVAYANVGGWRNMNINDPKVQAIADGTVQQLDAQSNSLYKSKLLKLTSVQMQVVEGLLYKLVFDKGETSCAKFKKETDLSECSVTKTDECEVELWVQPWRRQEGEITKFSCKPKVVTEETTPSQQILGGDDHDIGNYGEFVEFKSKYNKQYSSQMEERIRFQIFRENMKKVRELQQNETGTAKYGATEFADMSAEEFRKTHLTPRWKIEYDPEAQFAEIPEGDAPAEWDWRTHGAVSAVKNQGSCGSCWAFSTTGNIEGQWAIQTGKLTSLSEQELVDCDKLDDGCEGGLPVNAYKEIMRLGGLETETEYPYQGEDDKCEFVKSEAKVDITGYVNISSNEDDMAAWLAKKGPISIGINANAMQFYFGGISHPWSFFCDPNTLDHGVLIVGYGVEKGFFRNTPYWIIKNSWGTSWGESGYYRVYRGGGVCGVNKMPTSSVVSEGKPGSKLSGLKNLD